MSVVRVIDIMAQSEESWEDATRQAVAEASHVYPEILSLRVNRLEAVVEEDEVTFFRVKLKLAHVLDTSGADESGDAGEEDFNEDSRDLGGGQAFAARAQGQGQEFGEDQDEPAEEFFDEDLDEAPTAQGPQGGAGRAPEFAQGYGDEDQALQRGGRGARDRASADAPRGSERRGSGRRSPPRAEPEVSDRGSNERSPMRGGGDAQSARQPQGQGRSGAGSNPGGGEWQRSRNARPQRRQPAYD